MARNNVELPFGQLVFLAKECQTGAGVLGASIPLVINTSGAIGSDRTNLLYAEQQYKISESALTPLGAALVLAQGNARVFAFAARDWLTNYFGRFYTDEWQQVGFLNDSLAIPEAEGPLGTLVEQMGMFFTANPAKENAALNLTATRAGVVWNALATARTNYNAGRQLCGTRKAVRDAALRQMQRRLRGLCTELQQAIGRNDPRWREFGLNIPAAKSVPPAPKNVVVNNQLEGQFYISCSPATYAVMYRFFTKAASQQEPEFRGHSAEPLFHLTGLTPGTVYEVYVSASNDSGESRFSAPVTAVVSGAASAAA